MDFCDARVRHLEVLLVCIQYFLRRKLIELASDILVLHSPLACNSADCSADSSHTACDLKKHALNSYYNSLCGEDDNAVEVAFQTPSNQGPQLTRDLFAQSRNIRLKTSSL